MHLPLQTLNFGYKGCSGPEECKQQEAVLEMDKPENTKKSPLCALLSKERDRRVIEERRLLWANGCSSTEGSGATTIYIYSLPHGKRKRVAYENKTERNLSEKLKLRGSPKRSEVSSSSLPPQQKM